MELVHRKLTKEDRRSYLKLLAEFRPVDVEMSEDRFSDLYDKMARSSEIYVAAYDSEIVGALTVLYEQKFIHQEAVYAHFEDVIVSERWRRKGVGIKLLRYATENARNKGCKKCVLTCSLDNVGFYEKCGFEQRGTNMSLLF